LAFGLGEGTVGIDQRAQQRFVRWLGMLDMDAVIDSAESVAQVE
jgi:hypothetical protein